MLIEPVDLILMWYDELQVGQASLARLLGVHEVPAPDCDDDAEPTSGHLSAVDVRFGYRADRDVLHGVDLEVAPGSRVAVVGPSGAGKSTLGRLLAGVYPPRTGAGRDRRCRDERHAAGTGAPPRRPGDAGAPRVRGVAAGQPAAGPTRGDRRRGARGRSPRSTPTEWAGALPAGLDTAVGAGGVRLTPAQAQQVALARLVLADPHTLVLDEATSLLDPRSARHLERSLSAVLEGRTVVAIAHRLHTAHDADRIVVVEDGVVSESGPHDELVAADGAYAALWRSWRDEG